MLLYFFTSHRQLFIFIFLWSILNPSSDRNIQFESEAIVRQITSIQSQWTRERDKKRTDNNKQPAWKPMQNNNNKTEKLINICTDSSKVSMETYRRIYIHTTIRTVCLFVTAGTWYVFLETMISRLQTVKQTFENENCQLTPNCSRCLCIFLESDFRFVEFIFMKWNCQQNIRQYSEIVLKRDKKKWRYFICAFTAW